MDTNDPALFVSAVAIARDIKLPDGKKHKFYFRELAFADLRRFTNAENSMDDNVRALSVPSLIAAGVCTADGEPVLTAEQAARLKTLVSKSLAEVILELGGMGSAAREDDATVGNGLPPRVRSGSGTPSPSPSAAAQ